MHKVSLMMTVVLAAALAACGGGGDDSGAGDGGTGGGGTGGGGTVTLSCNTANYTAGAVSVATVADQAGYAGTGDGGGGPFDVTVNGGAAGGAQMVLSGSGEMTYKGQAHAVTSYCVDNTAGPFGKLLYIEFADGHFDISLTDAGADLRWAWGVAPDGSFFRNGVKQ